MKFTVLFALVALSFSAFAKQSSGDVLVFAAHFESDSECAATVSPYHWSSKLDDLRKNAVIVQSGDYATCRKLKKQWSQYTRMLTTKSGLRFFQNNSMKGFVAGADYQTLGGINVLTDFYEESGLE